MTSTFNDRPLLIAPRPVRVSSGLQLPRPHPVRFFSATTSDALDRFRRNDENTIDDIRVGFYSPDPISEKEMSSPRASPRSSEALEEFLSILRPSFFPPTSPILRARRQGSGAASPINMTYDSIPSYSSFKSRGGPLQLIHHLSVDPTQQTTLEVDRSKNISVGSRERDTLTPNFDLDLETASNASKWYSYASNANVHASPISRMQTRNPFQRHASYDSPGPLSPFRSNTISPGPLSPFRANTVSPCAIPLPLPTADEMVETS